MEPRVFRPGVLLDGFDRRRGTWPRRPFLRVAHRSVVSTRPTRSELEVVHDEPDVLCAADGGERNRERKPVLEGARVICFAEFERQLLHLHAHRVAAGIETEDRHIEPADARAVQRLERDFRQVDLAVDNERGGSALRSGGLHLDVAHLAPEASGLGEPIVGDEAAPVEPADLRRTVVAPPGQHLDVGAVHLHGDRPVVAVPRRVRGPVAEHVAGLRHRVDPVERVLSLLGNRRHAAGELRDRPEAPERQGLLHRRLRVLVRAPREHAAGLEGVDGRARVVRDGGQRLVARVARPAQPVLGDEEHVLVAVEAPQVLEQRHQVALVLERGGGRRHELVERHPAEGLVVDRLVGRRDHWRRARTEHHLVDLRLQLLRKDPRAVERRHPGVAQLLAQREVHVLVRLLEPLERVGDFLVVGRERERAIVGDNRHLILRQQLGLHEPQQAGDVSRRIVEPAPAEQDREHAAILRSGRDALAEGRRRAWRWGAGVERQRREAPHLLRHAVLEHGEVFLLQIGHRLAGPIDHVDVHGHEVLRRPVRATPAWWRARPGG